MRLGPRSHRMRRCSQMLHAKNGTHCYQLECSHSIANNCKQHQTICKQICVQICLRVLCELGLELRTRFQCWTGVNTKRMRFCLLYNQASVSLQTSSKKLILLGNKSISAIFLACSRQYLVPGGNNLSPEAKSPSFPQHMHLAQKVSTAWWHNTFVIVSLKHVVQRFLSCVTSSPHRDRSGDCDCIPPPWYSIRSNWSTPELTSRHRNKAPPLGTYIIWGGIHILCWYMPLCVGMMPTLTAQKRTAASWAAWVSKCEEPVCEMTRKQGDRYLHITAKIASQMSLKFQQILKCQKWTAPSCVCCPHNIVMQNGRAALWSEPVPQQPWWGAKTWCNLLSSISSTIFTHHAALMYQGSQRRNVRPLSGWASVQGLQPPPNSSHQGQQSADVSHLITSQWLLSFHILSGLLQGPVQRYHNKLLSFPGLNNDTTPRISTEESEFPFVLI